MTDGAAFLRSGRARPSTRSKYAALGDGAAAGEKARKSSESASRAGRHEAAGKKKDKKERKKDKKQKSSKKAHREGRGDTSRSVSHIEDRVVPTLEPPAPEPPKQSPKKPLAFDPRHMMAPKVSLSRGARETGVKVEM